MRYFMFLFVLFMSSTFAKSQQECLAPGAEADLKFEVQDQDGLGTCYANSSSMLLQGSLKLEKPVSYQQLAISQSILNQRESRNIFERLIGSNRGQVVKGESYAAEGGYACKTLKAAQEFGLCDAELFNLDMHGREDSVGRQGALIKSFRSLIEKFGESAKNLDEKAWSNITKNLAEMVYKKKTSCAQGDDEFIEEQLKNQFPSFVLKNIEGIKGALGELDPIKEKDILEEAKIKLKVWEKLKNEVLKSSPQPDGGIQWSLKDLELSKLNALIPAWKGAYQKSNSAGSDYFTPKNEVIELPSGSSPIQLLFDLIPKTDDQAFEQARTNSTNDFTGTLLVKDIFALRGACQDDLDSEMIKNLNLEKLQKESCFFVSPDSSGPVKDAFELSKNLTNVLKETKLDKFDDRMTALLKVLAPMCAAQIESRKDSLKDLVCTSISFNTNMETDKGWRVKAEGEKEEKVAQGKKWAVQRICNGTPVNVDVCTEFMRTNVKDTNFCKDRPKETTTTKHGNHAMAIVGYKIDQAGKARFLVQNSWGRKCPFPKESTEYQCEKKDGAFTGRFWIDENLLLRNTFDLSSYEKVIRSK
ncbi:MAG: hypothetical protein K2P81_16125 [Bacteriovoracaceae bacterium]|nr:hypothetical protein [Bacteriovoracaceae bacterium]